MNRRPTWIRYVRGICAPALMCLLLGARPATAQSGLIIEVLTTTRDSTVMPIGDLSGAGLKDLTFAEIRLKRALRGLLGNDAVDEANKKESELSDALSDASSPKTTAYIYDVYVRGDTLALVVDGQITMVWLVPEGGPARVFTPDAEGRMMSLDVHKYDASLGEMSAVAGGSVSALAFRLYSKPTRVAGEKKRLLGTTADLYRYSYALLPAAGPVGGIRTDVSGGAWITDDREYRDEIAAFYRAFASGSAGAPGDTKIIEGLTSVMADLTALGVPLATVDTARTYVMFQNQQARQTEKAMLSVAISYSEITSIRRAEQPVEIVFAGDGPGAPAIPGGAAPPDARAAASSPRPAPEAGCDCSCDAWKDFKALEKKSKEEIRKDPTIMAKAMCASQCAMKWVSCE
jgi:hypothetical protein